MTPASGVDYSAPSRHVHTRRGPANNQVAGVDDADGMSTRAGARRLRGRCGHRREGPLVGVNAPLANDSGREWG